jgi:asparagine synthase (glutamine-hydrolysing)
MLSWLVRWDTRREGAPSLLVPEPASETGAQWAGGPGGELCVLDGYLFDLPGAKRPAASVVERQRRDPRRLVDTLEGAFAFALWDAPRRSLVLGRDAMGVHPLFYSWRDGRLLASPSMALMKAQPEIDTAINSQLVAEMLVSRFNSEQRHETYFERIRRLPAAHLLRLEGAEPALERYWDPLPTRFEWATESELRRLPELLGTAVARCLDAGADSLALSGGFDSVSLAILANELRGERPPIHALSLRMTDPATDESLTQIAVAAALGMPQTIRTIDECLAGAPLLVDALGRSTDSPSPVLSMWQSVYTSLLEIGSRRGLSGLMLGSGGDETLGVDETYGADCLARGRLGALWRYYRAAQRSSPLSGTRVASVVLWRGAARRALIDVANEIGRRRPSFGRHLERQRLDLWRRRDPWMLPERLRRLATREAGAHDRDASTEWRYRRKMRRLAQHPLLMLEMDQASTWALRLGYRCFYPFWDRQVVELLLRTHPERLIAGGRFKGPLRRLVAERLRNVELPRRKVDFTRGAADLLRRLGPPAWDALDGELELSRLGIVDGERLRRFMAGFFAGAHSQGPTAWEILSTEHWLRVQRAEPARGLGQGVELVLVSPQSAA